MTPKSFITAFALLFALSAISPDSLQAQLRAVPFSSKKKKDRSDKPRSSSSREAAKRLALFPGAFRKKKKKSNTTPPPPTPNTTPTTGETTAPPADPRKLALEATILAAIPTDRHYREVLADAIATCYWNNSFKPLWKGKRLPDRLFRSLTIQLSHHALPAKGILDPRSLQSSLSSAQVDKKDLAKTIAIADAGALVRFGAVNPKRLWPEWDSGDTPGSDDRSANAFARDLAQAAKPRPASMDLVISTLGPKSWVYRELQKGFVKSKESILKYSGLPSIPNPADGGVARAGEAYPHAPALAAHLIDKGYLNMPAAQAASLSTLTPELTTALISFQKAYGLEADGIMGPSSWRILNTNPADLYRVNTINLHRARLMPSQLGERYVIVNLPSAELFGFEKNNSYSINMRVVHGKASKATHHTPVFRDVIQEVVFGPYWNVPLTIAKKELVPKALSDPSYISRNNYEIVGSFNPNGAKTYEATAENLNRVASGSLFVRQTPGSGNALGTVKFLLPNKFNVYMHDTPSKQYFARSKRDHSHGCIRLSDPKKMANWTLGAQGWSETKVKGAIDAKKRTGHRVENGLNVYVTYFTLFPRPNGNGGYILTPARDVYGLDTADSKTLGSVITWKEGEG